MRIPRSLPVVSVVVSIVAHALTFGTLVWRPTPSLAAPAPDVWTSSGQGDGADLLEVDTGAEASPSAPAQLVAQQAGVAEPTDEAPSEPPPKVEPAKPKRAPRPKGEPKPKAEPPKPEPKPERPEPKAEPPKPEPKAEPPKPEPARPRLPTIRDPNAEPTEPKPSGLPRIPRTGSGAGADAPSASAEPAPSGFSRPPRVRPAWLAHGELRRPGASPGPSASSASASPPSGGPGTDERATPRDLGRAFTRAIPSANQPDPAWSKPAAGALGTIEVALEIDEDGRIAKTVVLSKDPAPLLSELVRRTVLLLRGGVFALRPGSLSAGRQVLRISARASDVTPEAVAGGAIQLAHEFESGKGKAWFLQPGGRRIDVDVAVATPPLVPQLDQVTDTNVTSSDSGLPLANTSSAFDSA